MPDSSTPLVAVVMGSSSDWETMQHAVEVLERFGVPHERHIVSAHRTPVWMAEFATGAEERGIEVIIAGAGGAAHLPGMVAAHTVLPVLGVPVQSAALQGLDSLLSIVQMPGGVPVGTLAIGKAGATNAGLLAVAILSELAARSAREAARVPRRADAEGPAGTAAVTLDGSVVARAPGAALGVLGSGQLGRMFTHRRAADGLPRPHLFSRGRHADRPGGRRRGHRRLRRPRRAARVCRQVDVVTFEFENVPIEAIDAIEALAPVRPSGVALHTAQQRAREKTFLADRGFPTAPFAPRGHARRAVGRRGARRHAGRHQDRGVRLRRQGTAQGHDAGGRRAHLDGDRPPGSGRREVHQPAGGDLGRRGARARRRDRRVPAVREPAPQSHPRPDDRAGRRSRRRSPRRRVEITRAILAELQYVGVLCVEFFLSTDGELLVNELAPRPHNSGHLTFDAAVTSQFEQQVRAICGLPLGSTELLRPAAMANLLGDLWVDGEPNWAAACRFPDVKLHLYGKADAAPGPQDGPPHGDGAPVTEAQERVIAARDALLS